MDVSELQEKWLCLTKYKSLYLRNLIYTEVDCQLPTNYRSFFIDFKSEAQDELCVVQKDLTIDEKKE